MVVEPVHLCGLKGLKPSSYLILVLDWCPEVTDKALVLHFHHVQALVESFLLSQEHFVNVDC